MAILSLNEVCRKYGEKWGLRPLSADIEEGDFLTVLGPNGAGKSTLLKLLSRQAKPASGVISYRGKSIDKVGMGYLGKIGVISHQPFLYGALSALENLIFYARLYGVKEPEKHSRELLKRVDMDKRMHDPVSMYSRGMLQRTSIARALLNDPEIIFLDEPYTGLDRQASYMLTDILKEQIERKATILLVTHDLSLGYELASKVLILAGGECRYFGEKSVASCDFEKYYLETVGV